MPLGFRWPRSTCSFGVGKPARFSSDKGEAVLGPSGLADLLTLFKVDMARPLLDVGRPASLMELRTKREVMGVPAAIDGRARLLAWYDPHRQYLPWRWPPDP